MRWLRPDIRNPQAHVAPQQTEIDTGTDEPEEKTNADTKPLPWPRDALAQVRAIAAILLATAVPLSIEDIAARFTGSGPWKKRLPQLLDMLVVLGRAFEHNGMYTRVAMA